MGNSDSKFPWLYLLLACSLSWVFWIPVALTGQDYQSSPFLLLLVLVGVFGPGVAGIVLTNCLILPGHCDRRVDTSDRLWHSLGRLAICPVKLDGAKSLEEMPKRAVADAEVSADPALELIAWGRALHRAG